MNILVLTPYPPVLHLHGGGVRMFHNIRILSEKHSTHVISFAETDEEVDIIRSAGPTCDSVTAIHRIPDFSAHWFSIEPFMVREFGTPDMYKAVAAAVTGKRIDVIQCEYLQMAQYRRKEIFSILTIHETFSDNAYRAFENATGGVEKIRLFSRWMAMLNYEISMCNRFDRIITMTKQDADYLRSYAHRANIRDIPIGIDPEYFQPLNGDKDLLVQLLFMGNFRHAPNVEAAAFVLSEIAPYFPAYQFVVAGSHAPSSLQGAPNSIFTGYVSDTRKLFHGTNTIFLAPLFSGSGQRVKLLEAFALGSPVVTTSLGVAGFPVVHGREAMIADTASEFRTAVTALMGSADLRSRLAAAARRMILDHFSWQRIGRQLLEVVEGQ
jgi:glycosyltransferase involved in cell wall biosynthesis